MKIMENEMSEDKRIRVKMNNGDEMEFVGKFENKDEFIIVETANSRFAAMRENIVWIIATDIEEPTQ